jgi:carotenoid cleavage dioxygenase
LKTTVNEKFNSRLPENDVHPYRTGAWQPQSTEYTASEMPVTGVIPKDLNGVYLRNTENPLHDSLERYHPFDGDGMIHMMSFEDGDAQYRNRFVRTQGLATEIAAGSAQWAGLAEQPSRSPRTDGWGARTRMKDASSTDVVVHAGVALSSFYQCGDLYRLDPRTLEDLGRETWSGKFPTQGVSAHPKVDERTGELLFFNYQTTAPYLHYGVVSANRELVHYTAIDLPGPRLPHDMAFTTNFAILNDCPLFWDQSLIEKGIYATRYHPELPMRIGIIPRRGTNKDIKWFDTKSTYVLHWINAYEVGDEIILDGYFEYDPSPSVSRDADLNTRMFRFLDLHLMQSRPYRWRLNMKTGAVHEGPLSDTITEFGMINQNYAGLKYQYVYSAVPTKGQFTFDGLIKQDVVNGIEETYLFGEGVYGSETVVAPKPNATSEDDAYLITFVSDINKDISQCLVFEAQSVSDGPIARVQLPERISSGTHSCWASATQLP